MEMDTIVGKNNKGAIVTIIDRSTGWLIMRKLPHGKDAKEAAKTIVHLLELYRKWIRPSPQITGLNSSVMSTLRESWA